MADERPYYKSTTTQYTATFQICWSFRVWNNPRNSAHVVLMLHLCYSPMNSRKYITISRRFSIRSLLSKIFCTYSLIDQKKLDSGTKGAPTEVFCRRVLFFSSASGTSNFTLVWNFGSLCAGRSLEKLTMGSIRYWSWYVRDFSGPLCSGSSYVVLHSHSHFVVQL